MEGKVAKRGVAALFVNLLTSGRSRNKECITQWCDGFSHEWAGFHGSPVEVQISIATPAAATRAAAGFMMLAEDEEDAAGHAEEPVIAYVPVQVTPCVVATTET